MSLLQQVMRLKPWDHVRREVATSQLHQTLTALSLTSFGVGSVVGAGIFVMTGQAASLYAGPALTLSFIISSIACFLSGLCYAELASAIPVTGSAYTYVFVIVGEFPAWIVGACLTLEYMVASAAVAVGWSAALQELMADQFFTALPSVFASAPIVADDNGSLVLSGMVCNLPAVLLIGFLATLISFGVQETAWFNHSVVVIKLTILVTFVMYGVYYSSAYNAEFSANHNPFIPPNAGRFGKYGISGIFRGAGAIFFAYVGFDCICSVAAECKNPSRDLPRGLLATLIICTVLYIAVTYYLTGLLNYRDLDVDAPVIRALVKVNAPRIYRFLIELGTVAGLSSVCLVTLMSQPRLAFAMGRDGLLPAMYASVHADYRTPWFSTIVSGLICAFLAGLMPLDVLGELISFGTLTAFTMVCLGVIKKRRDHPEMQTAFKVPYVPWVPIAGALVCLVQMFSLPLTTFRNCTVYLSAASLYYYFYSRHHSVGEASQGSITLPPDGSIPREPPNGSNLVPGPPLDDDDRGNNDSTAEAPVDEVELVRHRKNPSAAVGLDTEQSSPAAD